ncbi:hypothetical protein F2Q69_00000290 [Brassica cretica]|uniref:VWFA domain-containing protein n=1 Tax=Brassica cretica TaxID=69181 RepID=A0A8S9P8S5_BRACR|nr:hypothetical protein F2Q69_00000290 [Brassica cretica]
MVVAAVVEWSVSAGTLPPPVQQVGSKDTPLVIECLDFNGNGNHNLIGKVQKSLADLEKLHLSGQGINLFLLTGVGHKHEDRALKSQLFVDKFTETVQHTFLEYLASGFELNFMVAIDFTASNGNPRLPDSLHYIDPTGRLNAYQRAIVEVGEVLQFYDTDKRFPAWGFGARPIDIPVSHCFNLNGSSTYCEVDGIQGIMNAYNGALFNVSFAGPTLFGPVINAAATIASESLAQNARRYYVLLIITALKSQLFVDKFTETVQHTFLEYLASGFELNFMVAIDFTASNGNPRLPDSLHYIDPTGRLNAYQRAIVEVGEVLQFYDTDKRFPAWGFGARPIDIPVSHCFNLNGSSTYCEVDGIQGIMNAYNGALFNVSFAGPTLFGPVINAAATIASESLAQNARRYYVLLIITVDGIQGIMNAYNGALFNVSFAGPTLFGPVINAAATIASESLAQNARRYYVLLIITDGVITDLQETKDALVSASDLPLSILIVGVGGADYKEMEVLDGDKGERLESSSGRVASRDIVQFVALRDMQYGEVSVVEALLAELPSQFLTYMRNRNITPTSITTSAS